MLEAAARIERTHPNVVFTFVGGGSQEAELRDRSLGSRNIQFLGELSDADYSLALAAADVLLLNERPTVHDMSLPSKLTSYMTAGRPIVAAVAEGGATERELQRAQSAVLVHAGQPDLLADAVVDLLSRPDLAERLGSAGRAYASEHLGRDAALHRLGNWVRALVSIEPVPFTPAKAAAADHPPRRRESADPQPAAVRQLRGRHPNPVQSFPLPPLPFPSSTSHRASAKASSMCWTQLQEDPVGYAWEILIVDDGSTDDTCSLVESYIPTASVPVRSSGTR